MLALLIGALPIAGSAGEILGSAIVIDGDSLRIGGEEIRLWGIDAPEGRQRCTVDGREWHCGRAAAESLSVLVAGAEVRCLWQERDAHGRALATCYRDATEINSMMVETGMALAYRHYSGTYIEQEDLARAARRGIWDGEFLTPWEWRRRARAQRSPGSDCPVKGNVNRRGDRIFHVRGWRDYDKVVVRPAEGDRCFDSEAEALAAGFRAPLSAAKPRD